MISIGITDITELSCSVRRGECSLFLTGVSQTVYPVRLGKDCHHSCSGTKPERCVWSECWVEAQRVCGCCLHGLVVVVERAAGRGSGLLLSPPLTLTHRGLRYSSGSLPPPCDRVSGVALAYFSLAHILPHAAGPRQPFYCFPAQKHWPAPAAGEKYSFWAINNDVQPSRAERKTKFGITEGRRVCICIFLAAFLARLCS